MPLLSVTTNVAVSEADRDSVILGLSAAVASMLGKPESYVMVSLRDEESLSFAGTTEPCAYLELKSIGLPADQTKTFSSQLCSEMESRLGVAADRVYIEFSDAQRHLFGWNNSTF